MKGSFNLLAVLCVIYIIYYLYLMIVSDRKLPNKRAISPFGLRLHTAANDNTDTSTKKGTGITHPDKIGRIVWISGKNSSLNSRIRLLNTVLSTIRLKAEATKACTVLQRTSQVSVTYGNESAVEYFSQIRHTDPHGNIKTVLLEWFEETIGNWSATTVTSQNLLTNRFLPWTGALPPCDWKRMTGRFLFKNHCKISFKISPDAEFFVTTANAVNNIDVNYGKFYDASKRFAFFVHVVRCTGVTHYGDLITKSIIIRANGCENRTDSYISPRAPKFNEVFVASQVLSRKFYFHRMIESYPKLAVCLQFLRANPQVKIHLSTRNNQTDDILKALGLNPSRIITGPCFANVVYWPRPPGCYEPVLPDIQVISEEFRKHIKTSSVATAWNSVVLVQRGPNVYRRFERHDEVEQLTRTLSSQYGLRFEHFVDNPRPATVEETMHMFYRARIVVAPHGAGLANMIFSRPGTVVIEAVDFDNGPMFLALAHVLGHQYHSVWASGGRFITRIFLKELSDALTLYLQQVSSSA
jgi:hypothetical protein